jgi:hypothetical protein
MSVFPFQYLSTNARYLHFTRLPLTPYYLCYWECCCIKHLHISLPLSNVLTFKFRYLPSAIKSNSVIPSWKGLNILYRMVKSKELTGNTEYLKLYTRCRTNWCRSNGDFNLCPQKFNFWVPECGACRLTPTSSPWIFFFYVSWTKLSSARAIRSVDDIRMKSEQWMIVKGRKGKACPNVTLSTTDPT